MNCKYPGTELTVSEHHAREGHGPSARTCKIRRFVRFAENTSVGYVHAGGKIGVLVNLAVGAAWMPPRSARTSPCRSPL